jgi:hypothetical protein
MLSSSYLPSLPRWFDLSFDIGSLPFVGMPADPLPTYETFFVAMDISIVVIVN